MEYENKTSVGEKRKFEECVKRKIFIFVNAFEGYMSSGIFEFDVKIITTLEKKPIIELETSNSNNIIIEPTETFFFEIKGPCSSVIPMTPVGACVVGDELFMIPDDRAYYDSVQPIPPMIFNLVKKSFSNPSCCPLERKISPLLTAVGDVVYALSFRDDNCEKPLPEPSFESLNYSKKNNEWSELRCSPFHDTFYQQKGHAVLGENFILVCLERHEFRLPNPYLYYSYNVATGLWKTVATTVRAIPVLAGKGAVLGNDIYTFQHDPPGSMDVFSYSIVSSSSSKMTGDDDSAAGPDIMLSSVKYVHGLELDIEWLRGFIFRPFHHRLCAGGDSCGLAIVKDQILCLLYSLLEDVRYILYCHLV